VPLPDGLLNPFYDYDFGPEFRYSDVSGVITMQPPALLRVLSTLVPTVDADGNETSGVASVLHQVPLGTYTGWNTVASGFYKGQIRTMPEPLSRSPGPRPSGSRLVIRGYRSKSDMGHIVHMWRRYARQPHGSCAGDFCYGTTRIA
jgi:hypothetical protein